MLAIPPRASPSRAEASQNLEHEPSRAEPGVKLAEPMASPAYPGPPGPGPATEATLPTCRPCASRATAGRPSVAELSRTCPAGLDPARSSSDQQRRGRRVRRAARPADERTRPGSSGGQESWRQLAAGAEPNRPAAGSQSVLCVGHEQE